MVLLSHARKRSLATVEQLSEYQLKIERLLLERYVIAALETFVRTHENFVLTDAG